MAQVDVQQAIQVHRARIHRAALVLTGDPWEADDLTQETFLVLAQRPDSFHGRSQLYTWLYGVLLNLERTRRRRNDVRRRSLRVLWNQDPPARRAVPAAEASLETDEWQRTLWAEVARLPDGQRQALVLRFSEHLSYGEIASVMNCPLGTVKSRIFNGLAALKDQFAAPESSETPEANRRDLMNDAM